MRRIALAVGIFGALFIPGAAQAAAPDGPGPWADRVVDTIQGVRADGTPVLPARSNPTAALGVAERTDAEGTFYSLGFITPQAGGRISLGYDNGVCNGPGADIELVESTIEPFQPELVDVFVSRDAVTYRKIADDVNKDAMVSLPADVGCVQFVRLVDQTPRLKNLNDGYDVDGVRAIFTQPQGRFSCSANALRADTLAIDLANANEESVPCADDSETVASTPPDSPVQATALNASTDASPGGEQGGTSRSSAADVFLEEIGLRATLVESTATVSCDAQGNPRLNGSSRLVGLSFPGQPSLVTGPVTIPIPEVGTLYLNYQTVQDGRLIQRAIFLDGPTLLGRSSDIVVAESEADFSGNPCP